MRGVLLTVDPVRRQSVDHQLFVPELQTFRRILVLERAFGSVVPDRLLQQAFHGHSIDVVGRNRDLLRKRFHVLPRALARRQRLQVGPLHQQGEVALEVGADLVAEVVGRDQIAVRAEVGFDRPVVVAVLLVGGGGGVRSHVFLLCVRAGGTGGQQAAEQQAQTARESLRHPDLRSEGKAYLHSIGADRSEEHTSELQSLMRISYAVSCLKQNKTSNNQ